VCSSLFCCLEEFQRLQNLLSLTVETVRPSTSLFPLAGFRTLKVEVVKREPPQINRFVSTRKIEASRNNKRRHNNGREM